MSDNHPLLGELAATSATVEVIAATLALEKPNAGQLAEIIHRTGLYSLYADVFVPETSEPASVAGFTAHIDMWVTSCQTLERTLRTAPVEQDSDEGVQFDIIDLLDRWFVEACQFAGMSNTTPATLEEQQALFDEFHANEAMRTLTELFGAANASILQEAAEKATTEQFMAALDQLREILELSSTQGELTIPELGQVLATLQGA